MPSRLRVLAADIKIAHSIFAMPFAVLAAFLAAAPIGAPHWPTFARQLAMIVVAMVAARTFAMVANRLLDRDIDARNPRTAGRALPSGRLTPRAMLTALATSATVFIAACASFGAWDGNWWPLALAAPVLAWIGAYGLFKRFSALCHFHLGSSLAMSPVAAALAVNPSALAQPAVWLIAAMVLLWVAGFDVIYALQDIDVDRAQGLHSLPARLGERGAMYVSRAAHVAAVALLVAAAATDARLGVLFAAGIAVVGTVLVAEHLTVARWGRARIAMAFFTLNGVVACVLGAAGVVDVLT